MPLTYPVNTTNNKVGQKDIKQYTTLNDKTTIFIIYTKHKINSEMYGILKQDVALLPKNEPSDMAKQEYV